MNSNIDEMSYWSWFIHSIGLGGILTLIAAGAVFCWSLIAVLRAHDPHAIGSFHPPLLFPLIIGVFAGAAAGYSSFADIQVLREAGLKPARLAIVAHFIESAWVPVRDAVASAIPAFCVLTVGRVIRTRRTTTQRPPKSVSDGAGQT